jgi:uncharacterized protein YndB with AHSA1/START domain
MTRVFDAPRRLVFEALTNPEHVRRWYGPHGFTVVSCVADLRPGGAYRIVQRAPDGAEFGFRGVYREIVPPSRLVYTWIFELLPDKEALVTSTLDERDGKTTLRSTTRFPSVADRDGYLATGASEGASQSMDRLAEVLRTMS